MEVFHKISSSKLRLLGLMPSRRMSPRAQGHSLFARSTAIFRSSAYGFFAFSGCNAAIAACAKSEQWPASLQWILCMFKDTLTPDEISFLGCTWHPIATTTMV